MKGPPPPVSSAGHVPVKSRLGNRDLVNLTVRREVKGKEYGKKWGRDIVGDAFKVGF